MEPRRSYRHPRSTGAALFGEQRVEEPVQRAGAASDAALGLAEIAVEFAELFFGAGQFVGEVKRGQDSDAQRVDRLPMRRNEAHLGVYHGSQLMDVLRVLSAKAIALIVDVHGYAGV